MKKLLFISTLFLSFYANAQVFAVKVPEAVPATPTYDTVQVNLYDSAAAKGKINRPAPDLWNNYSVNLNSTVTSNNASAVLKTKQGVQTGIRFQWIANTGAIDGYSDNTSSYGAGNTMNFPDSVFWIARYSTQTPNNSTAKWTGLDDGKLYKLRFAVSRNAATSRPVTYTINGVSKNVNAALNLSTAIEFDDIAPTGGEITITITFTNQFAYMNAAQLIIKNP